MGKYLHDPPHTLSSLDLEMAIAYVHNEINKTSPPKRSFDPDAIETPEGGE